MVSVAAESVGDAELWLQENRGLGTRVLPIEPHNRRMCNNHAPQLPKRPVLRSTVAMLVYDAGQPRFAWGKVAAPYDDNGCVLPDGAEIDTFDPERRWVVNWRGPTQGPPSITTSEAWLHGDAGVAIATLLNEERSAARREYTQERSADKLRKVRKGGGGSGEESVGGGSSNALQCTGTVVVDAGHAAGQAAGQADGQADGQGAGQADRQADRQAAEQVAVASVAAALQEEAGEAMEVEERQALLVQDADPTARQAMAKRRRVEVEIPDVNTWIRWEDREGYVVSKEKRAGEGTREWMVVVWRDGDGVELPPIAEQVAGPAREITIKGWRRMDVQGPPPKSVLSLEPASSCLLDSDVRIKKLKPSNPHVCATRLSNHKQVHISPMDAHNYDPTHTHGHAHTQTQYHSTSTRSGRVPAVQPKVRVGDKYQAVLPEYDGGDAEASGQEAGDVGVIVLGTTDEVVQAWEEEAVEDVCAICLMPLGNEERWTCEASALHVTHSSCMSKLATIALSKQCRCGFCVRGMQRCRDWPRCPICRTRIPLEQCKGVSQCGPPGCTQPSFHDLHCDRVAVQGRTRKRPEDIPYHASSSRDVQTDVRRDERVATSRFSRRNVLAAIAGSDKRGGYVLDETNGDGQHQVQFDDADIFTFNEDEMRLILVPISSTPEVLSHPATFRRAALDDSIGVELATRVDLQKGDILEICVGHLMVCARVNPLASPRLDPHQFPTLLDVLALYLPCLCVHRIRRPFRRRTTNSTGLVGTRMRWRRGGQCSLVTLACTSGLLRTRRASTRTTTLYLVRKRRQPSAHHPSQISNHSFSQATSSHQKNSSSSNCDREGCSERTRPRIACCM